MPVVVMQHVEESAHLRNVRSVLLRAPHIRLLHLRRIDDRIAAHLDGVAVAGEYGVSLAHRALDRPAAGQLFLATVRAIEDRHAGRLDKLLMITEALPSSRSGLLSAFGWVASSDLKGLTKGLLESKSAWRREVGLAACTMHGADPGAMLTHALHDPNASLRACGLRGVGRTARVDLMGACLAGLADSDPHGAFEAARSALLLGDRAESLYALQVCALEVQRDALLSAAALRLVLKVVSTERAREMLASLSKDAAPVRSLIRGIATAGDPHYVPWLITKMADLRLARIAGEAFSFVTGLDLAHLDLARKTPEDVEHVPNSDPADDDVVLDDDESLPWPDPNKIRSWWQANEARFAPGTRYFMGEPPNVAHCLDVLNGGFQRQRAAAAEYLSLLRPGTPLFNIAAPTWRQHRLLEQMGA